MRDGYSTKRLESDYAIGFITGLEKNLKQKRANQEWGLVLVKDQEVVKAYEQIKNDGEKFSISDKIAEGDTEEILDLTSGNSNS